jgi:hypothetical protein
VMVTEAACSPSVSERAGWRRRRAGVFLAACLRLFSTNL